MAIVPKMTNKNGHFETTLIERMDEMAAEGLRTLMFAMKDFSTLSNEESLKEAEDSFLEEEITLLGVTALEDLLQENCKECISDFRAAKIKVWMLTGDKGETA
jgi:phospholipid-translocating ATPase